MTFWGWASEHYILFSGLAIFAIAGSVDIVTEWARAWANRKKG